MKRTVLKLDTKPVVFTLIGISSHENDYRLSWNINEYLELKFVQDNHIVTSAGNEFSCFVHEDEDQRLQLISNRCDNGFLLGKYKNFDFILKFNTELNETKIAAWLHDLRKVPLISAAFPIQVNKQMLQIFG